MSIGERIVSLRKEAGLSQGQLASLLGVSRQAVSKWENDTSNPDTQKLIHLADVLNADVEYLASGRASNQQECHRGSHPVQIQEKIIEKSSIQVIERPVIQYVDREIEKPVIKRVVRIRYLRNPIEFLIWGILCFAIGILIGKIL